MTIGTEIEGAPRETPTLPPTLPEGALTTRLDVLALDDANDKARS